MKKSLALFPAFVVAYGGAAARSKQFAREKIPDATCAVQNSNIGVLGN